ncbi:outer membrane beta-barrel protein [Aureibacter tunicatorum]|uniref:Outer membrane protein beta-barrel domain-containing protein n=1 Tax=Aureibacter tunicatorum TaxID=866807 RepID=A0AAE4BUW2_9BACT|nr:outer membrane beta-barrel protein [Aureibacter tunicatorum]MDR6241227.1 hypothetical protein [Aureibacter tunicatorum]BDD03488.1 TonB-dependent receptor [Aureibacter tunicatorum]
MRIQLLGKFLALSIILFLVVSFRASAQKLGTVSGNLVDEVGTPVSFANVSMLAEADSTLINGAVADFDGNFVFEGVDLANYILRITAVGYNQTFKNISLNAQQNKLSLGKIIVAQSVEQLEAVEVKGQRQAVERKIDRLVFNVESAVLTSGTDGLEVLSKTPGVVVDHEGNIKINGKDGVIVMINDKRSYLTGKELSDMLKSMNADNISNIEVITNPSAKFDAEGNAGVLNIKMKESKEKGYHGSVYAGMSQGRYPAANGGGNVYFRSGSFSGYAQADYRYNERFNSLNLNREFGSGVDTELFEQHSYISSRSSSPSLRLGLDYSIDENNVIGFMFNGFTKSGSETIKNNTQVKDHSGSLISGTYSDSHNDESFKKGSINVNYLHRFDTLGQKMTMDFDFSTFENLDEVLYRSQLLTKESDDEWQLARSYQPYGVSIVSGKVDYEKPLGDYKLELGAKYSHSLVDNEAKFDSLKQGSWEKDIYRTNDFIYEEGVAAGYANFSGQMGKLAFQLGLRSEYTLTNGRSSEENDLVDRKYIEFFPSVFLRHSLNKNHVLSYSYSRRINRPTFRQLNPFIFYLDPFTASQGNPYLTPQFTNSFQVEYLMFQRYSISLSYMHAYDVLNQLLLQDEENRVTIQTFKNLDLMQDLTLSLNFPITIAKWWEMNNNVVVYGNRFQTNDEDATMDDQQITLYAQTNSTFILGKGFRGEFSGMYTSPFLDGGLKIGEFCEFGAGIEKSFFNDQMSLNFKVKDIFRTRDISFESSQDGVVTYGNQRFDSNRYNITLRYKFKKGSKVNMRRRSQGNKEEERRVN